MGAGTAAAYAAKNLRQKAQPSRQAALAMMDRSPAKEPNNR